MTDPVREMTCGVLRENARGEVRRHDHAHERDGRVLTAQEQRQQWKHRCSSRKLHEDGCGHRRDGAVAVLPRPPHASTVPGGPDTPQTDLASNRVGLNLMWASTDCMTADRTSRSSVESGRHGGTSTWA